MLRRFWETEKVECGKCGSCRRWKIILIFIEYLKYPLFLSHHQPGARSAVSAGHGGWTGAGVGGCSMELVLRRFVGRWTLFLICCCSDERITSSCECAGCANNLKTWWSPECGQAPQSGYFSFAKKNNDLLFRWKLKLIRMRTTLTLLLRRESQELNSQRKMMF